MATGIKPGEEYLGIGLTAPLRESHTGDLATEAGKNLIAAAWAAILQTQCRSKTTKGFVAPGRFMRDQFGTNFKGFKHENVDDDTVTLLEANYVEALTNWEKRAFVTSIESKLEGETIQTLIGGAIVGTNEPFNLVVIRNANGKIITKKV